METSPAEQWLLKARITRAIAARSVAKAKKAVVEKKHEISAYKTYLNAVVHLLHNHIETEESVIL